MYERIIEDFEHVKEVLASHGHNSVDTTLVFELLEKYRVPDDVVKFLLGKPVRPNQATNSSDNSWNSERSLSPKETVPIRPDNSVYLSATINDSDSSDDLEVLEHNLAKDARRRNDAIEPVDLTLEEIQEVRFSKSKTPQPIIDLTTESQAMEVSNPRPALDLLEPKNEDSDDSEPDTVSEDEMEEEDYYVESDEAFEESPPPSPIMATLPRMEDNREQAEENRVEEMLEENNNDPNNNLEDIEVLEQNNGNSIVTENLNDVDQATGRAQSPKPGCSKDSYYTGNDVGIDPEEEKKRRSDSPVAFEQDTATIQNVFPNLPKTKIQSMLRDVLIYPALNRVQIVIKKLIDNVNPAPIYSANCKRKQDEDDCPLPVKKFTPEESSSPEIKAAEAVPKSSVVKPAKLTIPETKAPVLKPSKLTPPSSKPYSFAAQRKSIVTLKPSKLEHLTSQYSAKIEPAKTKETEIASGKEPSNSAESEIFDDFNKLDQGMEAVKAMETDEAEPIERLPEFQSIAPAKSLPKPDLQMNPVSSTVEKKVDAVTKNTQISEIQAPEKVETTAEKPKAVKTPIKDVMQAQVDAVEADFASIDKDFEKIRNESNQKATIPSKTGQTFAGANGLNNGAIKKQTSRPETAVKERKKDKAWWTAERQIPFVENQFNKYMQEDYRNHRQPMDLTGLKVISSAPGSFHGFIPSISLKSELKVELKAPKTAAAPRDQNQLKNWAVMQHNYPPRVPAATASSSNANALRVQAMAAWPDYDEPMNLPPPAARAVPPTTVQPRELPNWLNYVGGRVPDLNRGFVERVDQINIAPQRKIVHNEVKPEKGKIVIPGLLANEHQPRAEALAQNVEAAVVGAQSLEAQQPRADAPPPRELFNPLINMFPAVDPTYIAGLCVHAASRNQGLESLIEILLVDGEAHPRVIDPEPEPAELNVDAAYENLQGLFPDAHPEYLRKMAEQYHMNQEAFRNFVQAKLENPDYPTMADYLKKIKITEQIQQYTDGFSPEKFLNLFPDPFAHFENPKRVHRYNVIAFEFLKHHFKANKVLTVQRAYRSPDHPYHLSLAAKSLEIIGPDMKSKRQGKAPLTEEIPLLQEIAFIRHKAEIKEYMRAQKREEKHEFKRLKDNNELLQCQCCYDDECMPTKCLPCSEGHIFCKSCIKTGAATKIGEGQTQFPCFVECEGEFSLPVLQKVLEPTMFSILLRKRQEEEVKAAALEGLVSCPFCHFASIPPPEDKVFKCLNPECMKETCRLCKELNHVPLRCDEVIKVEDARHYLEEKMTEALVRKCYKCSRPFFKVEGCNKMTCPCGAMTCYICGEPVRDYKHFNGQGSDRTDLCPLWSDNQMLNAQSVRAVAEAAEKEILKKNPNLKLDAKALMPKLPSASRGPHQDIANAHVLPVHARRV